MKERKEKRGEGTFRKGKDVIVLEAEAALTVAETLADNVAGGVFAPPLRMTAGNHISFRPAQALRLRVEESRSIVAGGAARTMWRRTHAFPSLSLMTLG